MANISPELNKIANSVYGKEMRSALHDSIKKVNDQLNTTIKPLTYSQYDALPSTEKMNGTLYFTFDTKQIFMNGVEYTEDNSITGMKDGNLLYFRAASAPLDNLDIELRPKQFTNGYGQVWGPGKGKNKFQVTATSTTIDGLTITVTTDSRVMIDGTSTDRVEFDLGIFSYTGSLKQFYLNGCPTGGGSDTYRLNVANLYDYGDDPDGVVCPLAPDTNHTVKIIVSNGVTLDHVIFKPMLRYVDGGGNYTFMPYSNVCAITKNRVITFKDLGKNIFNKETVPHYNNYVINTNLERKKKNGEGYYYDIPIAPRTTYTLSGHFIADDGVMYVYTFDEADNPLAVFGPLTYADLPYTFPTSARARTAGFSFKMGELDLNTVQLEVGTVGTSYEAFENHSYALNTGVNTWGGMWHVEDGFIEEEWDEIASYAGETLPGEWMSSMNTYSENGAPTVGAQVVYKTGNKISKNTGIISVATLRGVNTVWSTNNQEYINLTYTNEAWQDIVHYKELINEEYQALSEADQQNGTIYFIMDKGIICLNGVTYGAGSGSGNRFSQLTISNRSVSNSTISVYDTV